VSGPFVVAAGGTGGHLFPAIAVAGELAGRDRQVHLVTDSRTETLAGRLPGIALHSVRAGRIGGGPVRSASGLAGLAAGVVQARGLLRQLAPAAVIGFGGYPSLPSMLAAVSLGLPTLIHEQNAILGRANRLLARRVRCVATGFPDTAGLPRAVTAVHTGNPVRAAVLALAGRGYSPPQPEGPIELLVLGGSQGAHILAELVPSALAMLPEGMRARLRVSQQARPEDRCAVVAAYAKSGIPAQIESFFADVPERLARAHLATCRAGASTVAELAAIGRPAVLIPYPYAADDHQTANARAFAMAGGGRVIPQARLNFDALAAELAALLADPAALAQMARQASGFARRDAARQLALLALALEPGGMPRECAA
jgi:UDP-N-acetylglucosamine--N-acetylmuramyl-(pentapeptide) pyrophosphoryl-undecaprenol N-acetylglucosamine transferase